MNPKPSSSIDCAIRTGGSSSSKPSDSSTSAEPAFDETERLPCFATPAPAAAATSAAAGHAEDLREGLEVAREALDSGAAAERLDALIAFSRGAGG